MTNDLNSAVSPRQANGQLHQAVSLDSRVAGELLAKIDNQTARLGVIGLGYVGLPLLDAFTHAGFSCMGFDVDPAKVESLNAGKSYIKHVPSSMVSWWLLE